MRAAPIVSRHSFGRRFLPLWSKEIVIKIVLASALSILIATVAYAYTITHPNLKDAYGATEQAIHHFQEAQQANKGVEFGGHANNALDFLKKAQAELIAGDEFNNAHKK